jgi:hypothetical protein
VTSSMQYSLRPPAAQGRSFSYQIKATNGSEHTGTRSQVIQFDIPCGRPGSFLDQSQTFMQFEVVPTFSGTASVDSHASAFIHRLEVYHGSNLLESIDNYNLLYNMMLDAQVGGDQRNGHLSVSQGCVEGAAGPVIDKDSAHDAYAKFAAAFNGRNLMTGGTIPLRDGAALTTATKMTFAIPLSCSGLLSPLCPKYIPLLAMGASDLRVQITLEDPHIAMVCAQATAYKVTNATLNCGFLEFPPDLGASIIASAQQAGGGSLRMSTESFRGYESSMGANNNGGSFLIPARFSSLTSIYAMFRIQDEASGSIKDARAISGRTNPDVEQYQFRVGSELVPSAPVRGNEQSILELMKTFNSVSNIMHKSCITSTTYAGKSSKAQGTYMIGCELSSMPNKDDVLDSGVNTLSQNVHLECTCKNTAAHTVNTFAKYDAAIVITDGVASVVY